MGMSQNMYDLNVYIPEDWDEENGSSWDPNSWKIHVYEYNDGSIQEVDIPFELTAQEIATMNLNTVVDEYGVDFWYDRDMFLKDFQVPDRVAHYLKQYN